MRTFIVAAFAVFITFSFIANAAERDTVVKEASLTLTDAQVEAIKAGGGKDVVVELTDDQITLLKKYDVNA
ncbi:MAG: hypothetical protein GY771_11615 [bacterium]|nr:hypothetical protein [bacterium]